jgi:predicted NBD/HSP70 family sugar kinase
MNLLAGYGIVKGMPIAAHAGLDEPVRQRSLRDHNLGLVMRHVAAGPQPVSRADLAARTGLTKATVSALVDELLGGGLVTEVAPPPRTGAGRPATGLTVAAQGPAGLGLEVNVDYLAACVLDLTGAQRQLEVRRRDQRGRTPGRVLGDLADLAAETVAAAAADGLRVAGAAVGVPGLVADDGVVRLAPNLGWREVDVAGALRARRDIIGIPLDGAALIVDNEANLAALAELHAQSDPRPSFVYISGEIGVGAGIVLEGRLLRGSRGYGGELGHVTIHPDGVECRCGSRGCLEAYANQEVLLRAAGIRPGRSTPEVDGVDEALERLRQRAAAGRESTLKALDTVGTALGIAAAGAINLLDIDTVVLGGIYAPLAPWLAESVTREVSARTVTSAWAPVTVRAAALGTNATVVGAAGSVIRGIREAPAPWLDHAVSQA